MLNRKYDASYTTKGLKSNKSEPPIYKSRELKTIQVFQDFLLKWSKKDGCFGWENDEVLQNTKSWSNLL